MGFAYFPDGALSDVDELEVSFKATIVTRSLPLLLFFRSSQPGINPPGTSGTCAECAKGGSAPDTCVAPMYFRDQCYQGEFDNISDPANPTPGEDFGLDLYEPFFFFPADAWFSGGASLIPDNGKLLDGGACVVPPSDEDDPPPMNWNVRLRLTWGECFSPDFFYFCHIHKGMTGRVKQVGNRGL